MQAPAYSKTSTTMSTITHRALEFEQPKVTEQLNRIEAYKTRAQHLEEGFSEAPSKMKAGNPGIKIDSRISVLTLRDQRTFSEGHQHSHSECFGRSCQGAVQPQTPTHAAAADGETDTVYQGCQEPGGRDAQRNWMHVSCYVCDPDLASGG